ncbi:putative reverse transcriptase domain-containing protein [Tanacetum coccineum]|uniref:Reverse transcriptase domain-containing protein n=1 Tax=Tanacetum coccineum TaxID=301880 RepID=A0ABQ4X190_9ASTR
MLVGIGKFVFPVDFIILDMPEDIKVPLILRRPFLSTARAKIDVYKKKITLRVGEEGIIFKSVKPASSLIKRVYMLSLRERMKLDLEARLMGETLVINKSLYPLNGDYIELNNLNEPFELRRNQGDDLMPTIKEGEVIEKFRTRDDELDIGINNFPILENMDAYHDEGMGDVIFGEPFLREVGIKTRRFEGMITIYNGSGYHQKDRKPSQNDKTEHGMEKTVQNQGQSPKNDKVRVNTEESAVKPEPELKNTIECNLNPSDGPGKPNSIILKTVKTKWALNQLQQPICVHLTKTVKTLKAQS